MPVTMKKGSTDDTFQLAYLLAQGGLGSVKLLSGASDVQFLGDCHKITKQSQFHADFLGCQRIVPRTKNGASMGASTALAAPAEIIGGRVYTR
jgi:hypothetical protein